MDFPEVFGDSADYTIADKVIDLLKTKHVLITGAAGTGKSYNLRLIYEKLIKEGRAVFKTASTGCAAVNIGGVTVHSFTGIGINTELTAKAISSIKSRAYINKNCGKVEILIIDEISMLGKKTFEMIDAALKIIKKNSAAFGGVKLLLCGDFFQLSPVKDEYCFKSDLWRDIEIIELTEQKRQANDPQFYSILSEIRIGKCGKESRKYLRALVMDDDEDVEEEINMDETVLHSKCRPVEEYNRRALDLLPGDIRKYKNRYFKKSKSILTAMTEDDIKKYSSFLNGYTANGGEIELKENARVLIKYNIDVKAGLVNGAAAIVTQLKDNSVKVRLCCDEEHAIEHEIAYQEFEIELNDREHIIVQKLPLLLGWAITIHSCQGSTLKTKVRACLRDIFDYGQLYVALSRVESGSQLILDSFHRRYIKTSAEVRERFS